MLEQDPASSLAEVEQSIEQHKADNDFTVCVRTGLAILKTASKQRTLLLSKDIQSCWPTRRLYKTGLVRFGRTCKPRLVTSRD